MRPAGAQPEITIREFIEQAPEKLELRTLAGRRGLDDRRITIARIQKLGLALAGFTHYIHPGRVQIVGQSEIWYLGQLSPDQRREAIARLELGRIACVLVTKGLEPPAEFIIAAEQAGLPLLQTPLVSSTAIQLVTDFLQAALAPREVRHGVLLDVYGLGVLLEGPSGVGKSECALDLIARGHRLVSDDSVEVRRTGPERLIGCAPKLLREHMEIRGLGIINIRDLFGVSAISGPKEVDLVIRLERWNEACEVDRLGVDARTTEILGVNIPLVILPVSPGRTLSILVETAVRIHLLRERGYNAAQRFVRRHAELVREADGGDEQAGE
ncbi:HPr(Ser) kinase/phosphatase [Pyrinomonas methylaliphatogenes]|jgi:HPr kinase/phosphorylase|uniref:HPr kinase/phosphorylase n=1 Tax=Pyrinomonas methylaliphatogenes TaxID=454194 RepID=A0A0B6WY51_9BACT|nr:HPr(Ser) kinase/phosphatase [Pyrinomonas methylaliphatogenes]MBX5479018.1 HPr(Ser) kinase/phosphatase [Pyrinomonas methylaliphatogenes]CDM66193.1 Hpr(Ser) kinase/phosphatase [Pyrinomonas methylaliphatogenes]